jgi:hypothetical protein
VRGRTRTVAELTAEDRCEMLALFATCFDGVTPERFTADLADKTHVITLTDPAGRLEGFSTLALYPATPRGETLHVAASGDTLVHPRAWDRSILPAVWIDAVHRLHRETRDEAPGPRLVWLLLTSGFRTYRFLPVFFRDFWPRPGVADDDLADLAAALARERYGDSYDETTGIVRFPEPQVLRPELGRLPEGRRRDRHVDFFLAANPGHDAGDELVCVTDLSPDNLTPAGRRMVARGRRLTAEPKG